MLAYIFPGQGSQYIGMGKDLYDSYPIAKEIFSQADKVLGFSISDICFQGPQDKLTSTENAQPAILTVSIVVLKILEELVGKDDFKASFCAGLSLGEYTALVASGVVSFEDALCLVRKRGQYMEEAARKNPGGMLSIIGLSRKDVEDVCYISGCEIANLNCPEQVVISGKKEDILKAQKEAEAKGAKRAIVLEVSGAFHSSLMKDAELKLAQEIRNVKFVPPVIPIISNVTASLQEQPQEIMSNLIKQVSSSTYWEDSIRFMIQKGVDCFLEIGPGTVLKGLNRRIDSQVKTVNLGTAEQIREFVKCHVSSVRCHEKS